MSPDFDPRLTLVTDTARCGPRGVVATVEDAVAGGVTAVQVRAKLESTAEVLRLVVSLAEVCAGRVWLLVNDRVDVFLAARALGVDLHGVHVGQHDLPVELVRALVGPDAVVGLSAATRPEVLGAARLPAGTVDYLGVGTIRATSTKTDAPPPLGVEGFGALCQVSALPCVAIGGVDVGDLAAIRRVGGAGAAVVSAICGSGDPRASATAMRAAWER